jgi:hypothetical protein
MPKLLAAAMAAAVAAWLTTVNPARAEINDFEFQLVDQELKSGDAIIAIRLVDKRSGHPVPNAVIIAKRIDMAPDNMASMTAALDPVPSPEPGVYRFRTKLTMAGRWQLLLAAKVQGEQGTLESKLILKALP